MKTVIYGPVTEHHLADASLFAGIEPSEFITNGQSTPPFSNRITTVIPPDPMVGEVAMQQNHWRLALAGEALVLVGRNDHLLRAAESCGLLVYQTEG